MENSVARNQTGACPLCVRGGACPLCVRGGVCPVCVRVGACPLCVRGGVCPVCVRVGAFPLCVRGGACPVCVRDGICPVCGMGGLSPVCGSWADCWSFFSCFGPTGCPGGPIGVCWRWAPPSLSAKWRSITVAVARGRRWRDAGLVLLSLSVVWIVILPPFFFWGVSGEKELARATLGLGIATLVACVVCLLRWRRLRAEAEMRLWKLNAERRRRDMLCARAAAEGGGR